MPVGRNRGGRTGRSIRAGVGFSHSARSLRAKLNNEVQTEVSGSMLLCWIPEPAAKATVFVAW